MNLLKRIGFFTAFILPVVVVLGYYLGGGWNFLAVGFVFLFVTTIDQLTGVDTNNVSESAAKQVGTEFYYRFVTYVWVYVQLAFIAWCFWVVATGTLHELYEWVGFVVSVGLVTGGIGITVAHELGHKKSTLERFYSKVLLLTVCYMHFYIEHNRGHHVTVATPDDPATARSGENFYSFWFRSVFIGYAHAWKLERTRLANQNKSIISIHNNMILFTILPLVFCALITLVFFYVQGTINWAVPLFFFTQSIIAFTLLELVNYIEHYGIVRKQLAPGKYERVNPLHSWNASHMISNFFLFQLQRHSDHHANASKRYQVLNHYDESPQLPYGYPTMILLALIPPVWFTIMNPRLRQWQESVYQQKPALT
jgi:alkane 1-monooxygenase